MIHVGGPWGIFVVCQLFIACLLGQRCRSKWILKLVDEKKDQLIIDANIGGCVSMHALVFVLTSATHIDPLSRTHDIKILKCRNVSVE